MVAEQDLEQGALGGGQLGLTIRVVDLVGQGVEVVVVPVKLGAGLSCRLRRSRACTLASKTVMEKGFMR